jgi:hypothetical protein
MSAIFQGYTTGLIKMPGDSLTIAPSKLAILTRSYSCPISYLEAARDILVPGSVAEGYSYLKLFTNAAETITGPIVRFDATYYGFMDPPDLQNPYITSSTIFTSFTTVYEDRVKSAPLEPINSTDLEISITKINKSWSVIAPQVTYSYITTDANPTSVFNPADPSWASFSFPDHIPNSYIRSQSAQYKLTNFKTEVYNGITEVSATYTGVIIPDVVRSPFKYNLSTWLPDTMRRSFVNYLTQSVNYVLYSPFIRTFDTNLEVKLLDKELLDKEFSLVNQYGYYEILDSLVGAVVGPGGVFVQIKTINGIVPNNYNVEEDYDPQDDYIINSSYKKVYAFPELSIPAQ